MVQPVRDEDGSNEGMRPSGNVQASDAAAVLGQLSEGVIVADRDGRIVLANQAAARIHGVERLDVGPGAHGDTYSLFTEDGRPYPPRDLPLTRAVRGESVADARWRIRRPDGTEVHAIGNARPLLDEEGRRKGAILTLRDDTARHRAELDLAESEARFRAMADNISQLAWMADADGWIFWYNRRWYEYTGTDLETAQGWGWRAVHHPDHVDRATANLAAAFKAGEPWEDTFPLRSKEGEYRWFLSRARPIRGEDGRIVRWFGTNTDITERQRYEQHLKLLIDELNHRVKNTLAIVQSLAHQTFRAEGISGEARRAFEGRLDALATAHSLLTRQNWEAADLREVVYGAVHVHQDRTDRFDISGPQVRLEPRTAVTIAMALHELATNALKYGALSNDEGRVTISWSVTKGPHPRLHIRWQETGGPAVERLERRGFGSRMIERALASDLEGEVRLDFAPRGVVCEIDAPLPRSGEARMEAASDA